MQNLISKSEPYRMVIKKHFLWAPPIDAKRGYRLKIRLQEVTIKSLRGRIF